MCMKAQVTMQSIILYMAIIYMFQTIYTSSSSEIDVLLLIKNELGSPTSLESWNSSKGSHFCTWEGITCNRQRTQVQKVDLINKGIKGLFPSSVCYLTQLMSFNISNNALSGVLPSTIGQCSNLRSLSVSYNNLTGSIPSSLFNCSFLEAIELSNNNFIGSIPPEIGNLKSIQLLHLDRNHFTGAIPNSLFNCTSLVSLQLQFNYLSSNFPVEVGKLVNIQVLWVYHNSFTGSFPASTIVQNCTQLRDLSISNNSFYGPIPPELGSLSQLKRLWMNDNRFYGSIPMELGNLTALQGLQLGGNQLHGDIPASFGNFKDMNYFLVLSRNFLTGSLPIEITNLTSLLILAVNDNRLSGTLPKEFGNMRALQALTAQNNLLSGQIPSSIGNCSKLVEMKLSNNQLTGSIPQEMGRLQRLSNLILDNNNLTGSITSYLGNCSSLVQFSASDNLLSGEIPRDVLSLSSLAIELSLAHNQLTGRIPEEVGSLTLLKLLDLSYNHLSGSIPDTLGRCQQLTSLNLSHNSLQGDIPNGIGSLHSLQELDLSQNLLSGVVPSWFADLSELHNLNLSLNHLSGPLPAVNFTASSFLWNDGLCGSIVGIKCTHHNDSRTKILIAIIAPACVVAVSVCILVTKHGYGCQRLATPRAPGKLIKLSHTELLIATGGFDQFNIIGVGGVGEVYRGTLVDGKQVAVKLLHPSHENAESAARFIAEMQILARAKHRNLVKILGFCMQPKAILLPLMKMSLDGYLKDSALELTWLIFYRIIKGVAQAICYLHHEHPQRIIHCDLKPSNILLDSDMEPHISDFGISRILEGLVTQASTSRIQGSIGYMAPEYAFGLISAKADVYSFGVVLLETLTRTSPTNEKLANGDRLLEWTLENPLGRIDERLIETSSAHDLERMVWLASQCCMNDPKMRPTMKEVVSVLQTSE